MDRISNENLTITGDQIDHFKAVRKISADSFEHESVYFCNLNDIIRKHRNWNTLLPRVKPFHSVIYNFDAHVLKALHKLGSGFDCATSEEVAMIIDLGIPPSQVIFSNAIKPINQTFYARYQNVKKIMFENESELHIIKQCYPEADLILRIANRSNNWEGEQSKQLMDLAFLYNLKIIGLSFHIDSTTVEPMIYINVITFAYKLFIYARNLGFRMRLLDIGSGLSGDEINENLELSRAINSALDIYFPPVGNVQVIASTGTHFLASAYTLAAPIISISQYPNGCIMYVINDKFFAVDGIANAYPITPIRQSNRYDEQVETLFTSTIRGWVKQGANTVSAHILLPLMEVGDFFMLENMGQHMMVVNIAFNDMPTVRNHYFIDEVFLHYING